MHIFPPALATEAITDSFLIFAVSWRIPLLTPLPAIASASGITKKGSAPSLAGWLSSCLLVCVRARVCETLAEVGSAL